MQPTSFQYQPIPIQKFTPKQPTFLASKALDKSAPNLLQNKQFTYSPTILNKQSDSPQNPNKTAFIQSSKDLQSGPYTPKTFMQKNNSMANFSSPGLKQYYSPQLNKNEERMERGNRGEMSRSLVIDESQMNEGPGMTEMTKKNSDTPAKFVPTRRAPRMSQGYQPTENNFMDTGVRDNHQVDDSAITNQKQSNFMKIKKLGQESKDKKLVAPAFLQKSVTQLKSDMKRSSLEFYNSPSTEKTLSSSTNSFFSQLNNTKRKITASDFQKIKQLGNGKYGRVYLVRQKKTNFICALKVIEKKLLLEEQITEQFIRELKIQMYLNHPNIIKMYGYFDDEKNIYIILEVGTGGQLYHYLKKSQNLPEAKVAFLMKQICDAVNQIHSLRIIHRDIKPENIVLHDNIIKLCDFGWSVHQDNKLRTTFCGTPLYVCPQILRGKQYDEKIDIWSLGIMMYEMVVGENPFKITKQEELIKIVKDQIKIPSYVFVSSEARDFLDKCLQKNPTDRVTIRELVNHAFLKKYQEKDKKSFNL